MRLRVVYNANKFAKVPLAPGDTATVARVCPICGGRLYDLIRVCIHSGEPVLDRAACVTCGFVTFSRMPTQPWFDSFYRSDWDRDRAQESIDLKIEAPYEPLFEILLPQLSERSARVLEIGTGYGGALNRLRREGYLHVRGIEASEKRWRVCRERLDLPVALTTAEHIEDEPLIASGAPYDAIFSWHVIEHIFDIDKAIAAISRLLKPSGVLVVGVPHFNQEHLVYLAHYLPHIHSFTPASLTRLLHKHGLVVDRIDPGIRAVAHKSAGAPTPAADTGFCAMLRDKVRDDFGLPRSNGEGMFGAGDEIRLDYGMAMFQRCTAAVHSVRGLDMKHRASFALKKLGLGPGRNLLPMLHPRIRLDNILDPLNLLHWAVRHSLAFADYEMGARIELLTDEGEFPRVDLIYPENNGFAWVK